MRSGSGWTALGTIGAPFNWKASASEEWEVPVGAGVGKIFNLGKPPLKGLVQGYYNIRPSDSQTIGRGSYVFSSRSCFRPRSPSRSRAPRRARPLYGRRRRSPPRT